MKLKTPSIIKTNKFDTLFCNIININLSLYIITTILSNSAVIGSLWNLCHKIMWVTFFVMFIIFAYYFIRGKFAYIECLIYALLIALTFIIRLKAGGGEQIVFIMYLIICRFCDKDKYLKVGFWSILITLLFVISMSLLLKIPGTNAIQHRYGADRIRYGLGFTYTTFSANYYLCAVILSVFAIRKYKIIYYVLFFAGALALFILTDTKSAFACTVLMLLLIYVKENFDDSKLLKIISKINIFLFPVGSIGMWILSALYNSENKILEFLNKLTTGRIYLASNGLKYWGVTLFGTRTNNVITLAKNYIDSSYMQILFRNGVIFLVIVVILLTIFAYIIDKIEDKNFVIVLFVLGVHSILDPQLIMLAYNPEVVLSGYFLYKYMIEDIKVEKRD